MNDNDSDNFEPIRFPKWIELPAVIIMAVGVVYVLFLQPFLACSGPEALCEYQRWYSHRLAEILAVGGLIFLAVYGYVKYVKK